ncbi:MATH and LRR domain-containing protein PFE0570w-like [Aphidius gifuensis]|uniref:MATH and LRR domain-containing protein PFE0570w-like n=1 Tax=Aphidius gifuensis TaxID=684658 RepID=UPI001CDC0708|nr:MATH and LRR domain-containing protein PFE0570w-like [Aphidius gifuensis]
MFNLQNLIPIIPTAKNLNAKIFLIPLSLFSKIFCHFWGVSFQTDLLIMNFLGALNSFWDWKKFNWTHQVNEISNIQFLNQNNNNKNELIIETVLTWIVISRIIIAPLHTLSYLPNFYSILTWCRGKFLIPWLLISAFKNIIIELIVITVILLLYIEKKITGILVFLFIIEKILTTAPSIYSWLTMHEFYKKLEKIQQRKLTRLNHLEFLKNDTESSNIMLGFKMKNIKLPGNYEYVYDEKYNLSKTLIKQSKLYSSLDNIVFNEHDSSMDYNIEFMNKYSRSLTALSYEKLHLQAVGYYDDDSVMSDLTLTPAETAKKVLNIELKTHVEDKSNICEEKKFINNKVESDCCCSSNNENMKNKNNINVDENKNDNDKSDESEKKKFNKDNFECEKKISWPDDSWILKREMFYKNKNNIFNVNNDELTSWYSDDEDDDDSDETDEKLSINKDKSFEKNNSNNNITENKSLPRKINRMNISKKWQDRLQIIGGSFESTLQQVDSKRQQNNTDNNNDKIEISRSWVLDGMSIELVKPNSDVDEKLNNNYEYKNLRFTSDKQNKNIKIMTDSVCQTDDKNLDNVKKKLIIESEEIKALKAYNAKTLYIDKKKLEHQNLQKLSSRQKQKIENHQKEKIMPRILNEAYTNDHQRVTIIANQSSSELYPLSEQIPNVFHEIIKTARIRTLNHACNYQQTHDVDFGEVYLQEMMHLNDNNDNDNNVNNQIDNRNSSESISTIPVVSELPSPANDTNESEYLFPQNLLNELVINPFNDIDTAPTIETIEIVEINERDFHSTDSSLTDETSSIDHLHSTISIGGQSNMSEFIET